MDMRVIPPRRVTPPPCKDNGNVKEHVTPKYNSAISQVFCDSGLLTIRELKQRQRRRQRERHFKIQMRVILIAP